MSLILFLTATELSVVKCGRWSELPGSIRPVYYAFMGTTTVGILNVTGYVGAEVARLLYAHPEVRIVGMTGRSAVGKRLPEIFPHLFAIDLPITESLTEGCDVVFSALPHGAAAEQLAPYVRAGIPVVDVSADFRLKDVATYEATYKTTHPAPELVDEAVFGLPELHKNDIAETRLCAVPGCHATGVILALAPVVTTGVIEADVIADTKTGLSGAGRALGLNVHFSEADGNVMPYGLDGHRHLPEMTQELGYAATGGYATGQPSITFVPHYIPMTRGILSTCYATIKPGLPFGRAQLMELYGEFYRESPFVRVVDTPPSSKAVAGTNYCLIHPSISLQTGRVVVTSVLDNLGKGAAGAMVQCFNIMRGLPEDAGLRALGLFP
jgi:N-acetyl-gamma-glutamyl-phosphate reductase